MASRDSGRPAAAWRAVLVRRQHGQADEIMSRACAMSEGTLRPGHPDIASCLRLQAITRDEVGDLAGARGFENAGSRLPKRRSEASIHASRFSSTISPTASRTWANSRPRARCTRGPARLTLAGSVQTTTAHGRLFNQSLLDSELGDFAEARRGLQQAMTTWTRVLGPSHPNVARADDALARESCRVRAADEEALHYYARALEIRRRALGPQHNLVALTLSNMAAALESSRTVTCGPRALERGDRESGSAAERSRPARRARHSRQDPGATGPGRDGRARRSSGAAICGRRCSARRTRPWPRAKWRSPR